MNQWPKGVLFLGYALTQDFPQGKEDDVRFEFRSGAFLDTLEMPHPSGTEPMIQLQDGVVGRKFKELVIHVIVESYGYGRIISTSTGFHHLVGKKVSYTPDYMRAGVAIWEGKNESFTPEMKDIVAYVQDAVSSFAVSVTV